MAAKHLADPTMTAIVRVIGDLHINTSLSYEFEETRINDFIVEINEHPAESTIILAGDTFDRVAPSLEDIKIFYMFIAGISKSHMVYIINGNHDSTTFNFLPEKSFKYLKDITIINDRFVLAPWSSLKELMELLPANTFTDKILISHARCTIPPYITEEVSIEALSKAFETVVLGDIHTAPALPYSNVHYTTSPSSVTFTKVKKGEHGYVLVNSEDASVNHIATTIPYRYLVEPTTYAEAVKELKRKVRKRFRKVRYRGTAEELRELSKIKTRYVVRDFSLSLEEISKEVPEESNRLAEFLKSSTSLSVFAFAYFRDTLKVNSEILEEIRMKYEQLRTAKGYHK